MNTAEAHRIYRLYVTVTIEGDEDTLPTLREVVAVVKELVQDKHDHNLTNTVVGLDTTTYPGPK